MYFLMLFSGYDCEMVENQTVGISVREQGQCLMQAGMSSVLEVYTDECKAVPLKASYVNLRSIVDVYNFNSYYTTRQWLQAQLHAVCFW